MKTSLFFLVAILFATSCLATERGTNPTTITRMYTATQFGGGDVLVMVANPATNCGDGFWLSPSDPGFHATLSSLLAAYHTGSEVQIYGFDTQLWPGSSSQAFCRMTAAIVQK